MPRRFVSVNQECDLVAKQIFPIQKDHKIKWTPKYVGHYVVKKGFSRGSLILTSVDGDDLHLSVNSDVVKKSYA
ncbi:hypothetical protein Lal_00039224 [Lupinus albus]|nr:hypothetical protein Lal_00039224 [Lupinus albus]